MIEAELAFTQSLNDLMTVSLSLHQYHSHRIDRYLDTRHPIATAANCVATDHFQKSQSQDGILLKLLLSIPA